MGNGDGSFRPRIDLAVGSQPRAVAVHDFNGDGRPDLVSADFASSAVSVLLGHGDGTFGPAQRFAASDGSVGPTSVAVGDVNGDGRADLVLREQGLVGEGFDTRLGVLLGNGDGTFKGPIVGGFQFGLIGLAVGDFNNDGLTDAALGASQSVPGQLAVFAQQRRRHLPARAGGPDRRQQSLRRGRGRPERRWPRGPGRGQHLLQHRRRAVEHLQRRGSQPRFPPGC